MALKVTITTLNDTYRISSHTIEEGGYCYEGRVRNAPSIEQIAKADDQGNVIRSVPIEINNLGAFIDLTTEELWGSRVTVSVDGLSETWAGKIQKWSQSSDQVLSILAVEDSKDVFKRLLPDEVIRFSTYSDAARDASNVPVPIPLGGAATDPLRIKGQVVDRVNFRYLFCSGEIRKIVKVWKDREEITTGFTSYLGTSGQATYPGFVYIQFAADPRDSSGRWPEVYIDAVGLKLDGAYTETQSRNPARVLYHLLTQDASGVQGWGLGVDPAYVDTASFTTAITDCDTVGFKLDGLIDEQRPCAYWIDQICKACRGSLAFEGGMFVFRIDKNTSSVKTFNSENMALRNMGKGASNERKNRVVVDYRLDPVDRRFLGSATREDATSQAAIGVNEYRPQLLLVRDHTAAGKVADYFSNVEKFGELRIEFATKDFSVVAKDSVITIDRTDLGLSSALFRVQKITINNGIALIEARAYSSSYFDTSAGSSTTDPDADPKIQGIYQPPPAVVSGLNLSTGNTLLADGTTVAYVDGEYTAGDGFLFASIEYGEGASPSTWTNAGNSTGGMFHVQPLKNGQLYTFRVTAKNNGGSASPVTGTITTSSDTTAPGKPVVPTLSLLFKNIRVKCFQNATKAADMAGFKVYRNTSNDSASASEIGWVGCGGNDDGVVLLDEGTAYGATYYYWTKAVDRTGNASVFSDAAGPVTTSQIVSGDLSAGSVCAMHINAAGISADCITAGAMSADRITGGSLDSCNWGASAGSCFNLNCGYFALGGSSAPKLSWNGTSLVVCGTVCASAGTFTGVVCATSGCFSGTITSTAGTIGGWVVCSGYIYNSCCSNSVYLQNTNCRPVIFTFGCNGTVGSYAMHGAIYRCGAWQNAWGFSATQTTAGDLAFATGLVTGTGFCLPDSSTSLTSGCPFFWVGTSTSYMKWYNGLLTLNGAFRITRTASDISSAWITLCNTCSDSGQYCLIYAYSCASLPIYAYTTQNTAIRASAVGDIGLYATTDANIAVNACAAVSYGVCARAMCCFGVFGYACSCYGVCGQAYFAYPVGGNGAYYNASTRALKTAFEDVEVLPGLRCLCIQKWTWNDQNMRGFDEFIGPVAEDVQAAFRLTFANDGVYQLDGIALKAAQELDACITAQNLCIESLAARLANIESRISQCA